MFGTVKRMVRDRGFGFIRGEDGQERFFHRSSCQDIYDSLREGERVQFEEEEGEKGPRATSVERA